MGINKANLYIEIYGTFEEINGCIETYKPKKLDLYKNISLLFTDIENLDYTIIIPLLMDHNFQFDYSQHTWDRSRADEYISLEAACKEQIKKLKIDIVYSNFNDKHINPTAPIIITYSNSHLYDLPNPIEKEKQYIKEQK